MVRLHPILLPFSGLLWGEFKSVPLLSHTNRQLSECFIDSTIPLHRIICIDFNTVSRCLSTPFLQKKYARGNCSSCTRVQRIVIPTIQYDVCSSRDNRPMRSSIYRMQVQAPERLRLMQYLLRLKFSLSYMLSPFSAPLLQKFHLKRWYHKVSHLTMFQSKITP